MQLTHLRLSSGAHKSPKDGACIMELIGHVMGCGWTDHPECTSPALAAFCRTFNDGLDDENRQRLLPYLHRIAGAKGTHEQEMKVAYISADYCVRVLCPTVFELYDKDCIHAKTLRALPQIVDQESLAVAADAAWAAWAARAAWAAEAAVAKSRMIDLQFECLDAMLAVFEIEPDAEEAILCMLAESKVPDGLVLA